jgi:hypothetical protein
VLFGAVCAPPQTIARMRAPPILIVRIEIPNPQPSTLNPKPILIVLACACFTLFDRAAAGAEEATGAHAEAALLLYLQAAARALPDLLAKSKQLQDGANQRGGDAGRGDCIRAYAKSCVIGMLDGVSQRNAHERSKGTAGHACSICVMERLGAVGGKVSSERFVGGIVGALVRVVDGPRIIKAGLAARR